ncbi:MAG: hypothetical protein D6743_17050 [Calditrichaeota bacterium]|nr:MAG: hypothetical protein D6743_17050 [Calditrichota bacterium]
MTVAYHAATRTLISADLYLADRIRYVRRDEDLTLVMESLRRVLNRFEVENLLCAHRPTVGRGREALAAKLAFLEERQERLFALLQDGASLKRAVAEVLGGEDRLVRRFTSGDVSVTNLAQNLLGGARPRRDVIAAVGEAWAWQRFNDHLDGENVRVRSSGRLQA